MIMGMAIAKSAHKKLGYKKPITDGYLYYLKIKFNNKAFFADLPIFDDF
jgi:hypothetical protein